jgi:hypothetical protein
MIERQQVNLRLEKDLVDQLDDLARTEHADRTEIARRILVSGVAEARIERALRDYAAERTTAWRAARDAGISLYEMLDRIAQRGIPYELDPDELGQLGTQAPLKQAAHVAEKGARYESDADSGIDRLRAKYRPKRATFLFVGESSPAQGTHFYRANSNLFRAMRAAYAAALGESVVPSGEAFLRFFADRGGWLVDLADRPVNSLPRPERRAAIEEGVARLARTIQSERPDAVIAVKRDIGEAVHRAAELAGSRAQVVILPFPVRQWAPVFVRDLAQFIRG